jgi:hypothetical protein
LDKPGRTLILPGLLFLAVASLSAQVYAFICFLVTARIIRFPRLPASSKKPPARFAARPDFPSQQD